MKMLLKNVQASILWNNKKEKPKERKKYFLWLKRSKTVSRYALIAKNSNNKTKRKRERKNENCEVDRLVLDVRLAWTDSYLPVCVRLLLRSQYINRIIILSAKAPLGSITAALSCLVYPPREETLRGRRAGSFPEQRLLVELKAPFTSAASVRWHKLAFNMTSWHEIYAPNKATSNWDTFQRDEISRREFA